MYWTIFICYVYLWSIFTDSYNICFGLFPLLYRPIMTLQSILSGLMVIDIVLTFLTAFQKELRIEFDEDEYLAHKNRKKLLKSFSSFSNKVADESLNDFEK